MACCVCTRWAYEDLLIHEGAHALMMSAEFTMTTFAKRVHQSWLANKDSKLWKGTYGSTNRKEYFVSSQNRTISRTVQRILNQPVQIDRPYLQKLCVPCPNIICFAGSGNESVLLSLLG